MLLKLAIILFKCWNQRNNFKDSFKSDFQFRHIHVKSILLPTLHYYFLSS